MYQECDKSRMQKVLWDMHWKIEIAPAVIGHCCRVTKEILSSVSRFLNTQIALLFSIPQRLPTMSLLTVRAVQSNLT